MKTRQNCGQSNGSFPVDLLSTPAWRALTPQAQTLYFLLWIDGESTHAGTREYDPEHIAARVAGFKADTVYLAAEELVQAGFLAIDDTLPMAYLRGWIARDGVTAAPKLGVPFRAAFDEIADLPSIRKALLSDLRSAYDVDTRDHAAGKTSRSTNAHGSTPGDPDREGSFWNHSRLSDIVSQMPEEGEPTPLDGLIFTRSMPRALGQGSGRDALGALDWMEVWAYLTLYVLANDAGVVRTAPTQRLLRCATGEEITPRVIDAALRNLTHLRWIETARNGSSAVRVRFFHVHEGSFAYHFRGPTVTAAIQATTCPWLRQNIANDLALALALRLSPTPPRGAKANFWVKTTDVWDPTAGRASYAVSDLVDHGLGPGLPTWHTGVHVANVDPRSVPRILIPTVAVDRDGITEQAVIERAVHPVGHPADTLTDRSSDTLTDTLMDRSSDTLTDTLMPPAAPLEQSGFQTPTDTLSDTLTDTLSDTLLISGSWLVVRGSWFTKGAARVDVADPAGRGDVTDDPTAAQEPVRAARAWIADVNARHPGLNLRSTSAVVDGLLRRMIRGESAEQVEALVVETLRRDGVDHGAYLARVIASDRPATSASTARRAASGASAGAAQYPDLRLAPPPQPQSGWGR